MHTSLKNMRVSKCQFSFLCEVHTVKYMNLDAASYVQGKENAL